jgi:hypothetical protein
MVMYEEFSKKRIDAMSLPYNVTGFVAVLSQPSAMSCWATVYTMIRSWKDQTPHEIGQAVERVGERYRRYYDLDIGLPSDEFGPFLSDAHMTHQPMINMTIDGWESLLRNKGLLWVGTLAGIDPSSGLHSRIIEGMEGDGGPDGTFMKIVDPDGGRRYREGFRVFLRKYEDAFRNTGSSEYFQIRHF